MPGRGSETRQRSRMISIRLTPLEFDEIEVKAARAGLERSDYARSTLASTDPIGHRRLPAIQREAVRELIGHLGRIGNNVNQLAHQANRARGS